MSRHLPKTLVAIRRYLLTSKLVSSSLTKDGRANSLLDEDAVVRLLRGNARFKHLIQTPPSRMWYDLLVYDKEYGWFPLNIKSTTTTTADNCGNLALCVQAYTNYKLDFSQPYHNGALSRILVEQLRHKKYNRSRKKDYFFLVINKNNKRDIVLNSVLGLSKIRVNTNNLPFQVCWANNREYVPGTIKAKVATFQKALRATKPSWVESFLQQMRRLRC